MGKLIWVPFNKYGSSYQMQSFDAGVHASWHDHYRCGPFKEHLSLVGTSRGRSAVNFIWESRNTDTTYSMSFSNFMSQILHRGEFGIRYINSKYDGLSLDGWFTFVKQGLGLSIKYIGRKNPETGAY